MATALSRYLPEPGLAPHPKTLNSNWLLSVATQTIARRDGFKLTDHPGCPHADPSMVGLRGGVVMGREKEEQIIREENAQRAARRSGKVCVYCAAPLMSGNERSRGSCNRCENTVTKDD